MEKMGKMVSFSIPGTITARPNYWTNSIQCKTYMYSTTYFQHFPGLESPGKRLLVLESSGNLFNSSKRYIRRINIEILGVKGLM